MDRIAYNLDSLALNSAEFNGYPCRRIAIAIVINNDAEQVDRSREQEDQPQQSPTQISLNRTHRVPIASNEQETTHVAEDYIVSPGD